MIRVYLSPRDRRPSTEAVGDIKLPATLDQEVEIRRDDRIPVGVTLVTVDGGLAY